MHHLRGTGAAGRAVGIRLKVDDAKPVAESINCQLQRSLATYYTGPMARTAREQALQGFRDGGHLILVATAAIEEGSEP